MNTNCSRYREENGKVRIEISLRDVPQLFDTRDPSPFWEKDLDENAVDYIVAAAEEIRTQAEIKLILKFSQYSSNEPTETLIDAVHTYFAFEADLTEMRLREKFKRAHRFLLIGVILLPVFLTLGQLSGALISNPRWSHIVTEGFSIAGWVVMWRPIDSILYDWLPIYARQKLYTKLSSMEVEVHRV